MLTKTLLLIFLFSSPLLLYGQTTSNSNENCDQWLYTPDQPSLVRIGDLDVEGDQITVEARFNRTKPWNGADFFQGDLVSKHENSDDANYLLRPSSAEITTTNGYFKTPPICPIELNKTYHAALVYNGKTLKFYRNGFLMSEIYATGNLVTNDWATQIGLYFNGVTKEQFVGYITEVRIWNVARSQKDIRSYISQSLPNPQTQFGLVAYYTFDNLKNKQGNSKFNGQLIGSAAINKQNPICNLIVDSCGSVSCDAQPTPDFTFKPVNCTNNTFNLETFPLEGMTSDWNVSGISFLSQNAIAISNTSSSIIPISLTWVNQAGCKTTIIKNINIDTANESISIVPKHEFCIGDSLLMQANTNLLNVCWLSSDDASLPKADSDWIKPVDNSIVQLKGINTKTNLISDPGFEQSNTITFTDYKANDLSTGGYSFVNKLPDGFQTCSAKVNGRMVLFTSANDAGKIVWGQSEIKIDQNTRYLFKMRILAGFANVIFPLSIQFNGKTVYKFFSSNACKEEDIWFLWNSGNNKDLNIKVVSGYLGTSVMQFGLDDIYFGQVSLANETIELNKKSVADLSLTLPPLVCEGNSATLSAQSATVGSTIFWEGDNTITKPFHFTTDVHPNRNNFYKVTVSAPNKCSQTESFTLKLSAIPSVTLPDTLRVCAGAGKQLQATYSNVLSVKWFPTIGISDSTAFFPSFEPKSNSMYVVHLNTIDGCKTTDTLQVVMSSLPIGKVDLSNNIDCNNSTATLKASGGKEYLWYPNSSITQVNKEVIIVNPTKTTTYTVDIKNDEGCVVTQSTTVLATLNGKKTFYLPNAFTPNNDGINDCFGMQKWPTIIKCNLEIYNRWGERVFYTKEQNVCWNGQFKGHQQPSGLYIYKVEAESFCGPIKLTGTVTLLH